MRIGTFVEQQDRDLGIEGTNICGVLVRVRPECMALIHGDLMAMDGVEVHRTTPDGRMVITVEDTVEEWAGQIITRIPTFDGVLSATLIYHHCEIGDLDKEQVQ